MVDRRWSAKIQVGNATYLTDNGETVDAEQSDYDLQADQAKSAIREAGEYILSGIGTECRVQLYKTTAKGMVRDQSFYVYQDSRTGKIKAQR